MTPVPMIDADLAAKWRQAQANPLLSAKEIAEALNLPLYILQQPSQRQRFDIPHYRLGKLVRFRLDEVMAWTMRVAVNIERREAGVDHAKTSASANTLAAASFAANLGSPSTGH